MGKKRTGTGKLLLFHFACIFLIVGSMSACAQFGNLLPAGRAETHLNRAKHFLEKGEYWRALKENKKALQASGNTAPGDRALYNMGKIRTIAKNEKQDYRKARSHFQRLIKDFPGSEPAKQAKIWEALLSEILDKQEKLRKLEKSLQEKKNELEKVKKKYESGMDKLEARIEQKEEVIEYLRKQLEKRKEIDLEINRREEN